MVAGGISSKRPGELIFCVGTMDTSMYIRAMSMYKSDIERLDPNLYFPQDKALCHKSAISREVISDNFKSWDVDLWPANSPDLSPIESLWAILDERLNEKSYRSLDEKKVALLNLWNSIPVDLCQKLCASFDTNIDHVLTAKGGRLPLNPPKKIKNYKKETKFNKVWNESDTWRIVYKDALLMEMKTKSIKRANKLRKKLDKEFNKYARDRYGIRNFINKNGPLLLIQGKIPKDLKEQYEAHNQTKKDLFDYVQKVEPLDADQFFEFLSPEQRLNVIN